MFLFEEKIYNHIDLEKTITRSISNEKQMLFCDTKNRLHFDITHKYWFSPEKIYALSGQRQEILAKTKEQKKMSTIAIINNPDGRYVETEINVVLRNNIFHSWAKILQKNNPTNIRINYSSNLNFLFVNYKFPVSFDDHAKTIPQMHKLIHQYNIKVLILSIQNPGELGFLQLNNLSMVAKSASQSLSFASDLLVFCVTNAATFQKVVFIFGSYGFSSTHYAGSLREAVLLAQLYTKGRESDRSQRSQRPIEKILRPVFK